MDPSDYPASLPTYSYISICSPFPTHRCCRENLKTPELLNALDGWQSRFKDSNSLQRITAARWKIKSWNKFSSPCKAELESLLEKDQATSKWSQFPNPSGICINSPRILQMLNLVSLLATGQNEKAGKPCPLYQGTEQPCLLPCLADKGALL